MPAPIVQVKFIDSIPSVCGVEPDIPLCKVCGPIVTADKVKLIVSLSDFCQPQQPSEEQYSEKQPSDVNVYCNKTEGFLTDLDKKEMSSGCYHKLYTPMEKVSRVLSVHWKGFVINKEINMPVSVHNFPISKNPRKLLYPSSCKSLLGYFSHKMSTYWSVIMTVTLC